MSSGPLAEAMTELQLMLGEALANLVLAMQAGVLAGALDALFEHRVVVHEATGRIAAQLNVGVAEALVRSRAWAFSSGQPLHEVARLVVEGTLRFDDAARRP